MKRSIMCHYLINSNSISASVFTHDEEFGGRADIMIDQLLKLSYAHNDSSVLTVVYEVDLKFVFDWKEILHSESI